MAFADAQSGALIPYGANEADIKLSGTVTKGDAVGYSDGWQRALATAGSVVQMRCVAAQNGVSGQTIKAYFGVTLMNGRLSGGTEGSALYVAEGTDAGQYIETIPTTATDATTVVGYMLSATLAVLIPSFNVDSVA